MTHHRAKPEGVLGTFLDKLRRPLGHIHDSLVEFGIADEEDLNVLCELREHWPLLQAFLAEKGVSRLEWMIVKDGLEARARATGHT